MSRKDKLQEVYERARENYLKGYNCAQSVMEALGHVEGLEKEDDLSLVRMVTGLGGGLARHGQACGALVAGVLWLGMAGGTTQPEESRQDHYQVVSELIRRFQEKTGHVDCASINGLEDFESDEHKRRCSQLAGWTAQAVLEMLTGDSR